MGAREETEKGVRLNRSVTGPNWLINRWRSERGANLIEMSFIVVLMLALVVGAVDLGFAYQHYGVVLNASREGARLYSRTPCLSSNRAALRSAIVNAVVNETNANVNRAGVRILPQNVTISPDPVSAGCPAPGAPVEVRVRVLYRSQFGEMIGLGEIPISASATMMHYGSDTSQSGS